MRNTTRIVTLTALLVAGFVPACCQAEEQGAAAAPRAATTGDAKQQVIVRAQLLEVSVGKMRKLGLELVTFGEGRLPIATPDDAMQMLFENRSGHSQGLLDALQQNNLVRVLAAPTLVTLEGKAAKMSVGGKVESGTSEGGECREQFIGTNFQVTPTLMEDGKVRLELCLSCSEVEPTAGSGDATQARVRRCEVDTTVVVSLGETCIVAGAVSPGGPGRQSEANALVLTVEPTVLTSRRAQEPSGRTREARVGSARASL